MSLATVLSIRVFSDVVVKCFNPEMADFGNQRGAVYGEIFYLVAEDVKGYRWAHDALFDDQNTADKFCAMVTDAVARGRKLDEAHWAGMRPAYGSLAFQESGQEEMDVEEERWNDLHPLY